MHNKLTKTILYIAFFAMIILAGYVIFISSHTIPNKYYFYITAAAFFLVCAVFLILIIKNNAKNKGWSKSAAVICIVLVLFQLITLPVANFLSETLPVYPRGTIFQVVRFKNSISQNEVGLMMRYYLEGKTVYANNDYPAQSHNGYIFITDEYDFAETDYPILTKEEAQEFRNKYEEILAEITVQENPKLELASFLIYISTEESTDKIVLLTDENNNWYFMTNAIYEEAFGG